MTQGRRRKGWCALRSNGKLAHNRTHSDTRDEAVDRKMVRCRLSAWAEFKKVA